MLTAGNVRPHHNTMVFDSASGQLLFYQLIFCLNVARMVQLLDVFLFL